MREIAVWWYGFLNTLFSTIGGPLREIIPGAGGSVFVAALLGMLAATSPCQLSTNASAIAYMGQSASKLGRRTGLLAIAYVAGKVLVKGPRPLDAPHRPGDVGCVAPQAEFRYLAFCSSDT